MTSIKSIDIIDLASGASVQQLTDRKIIRSLPAKRSIRVVIAGDAPVGMKICINGKPWIERRAPWVFGGDKGIDAGPVMDKAGPYTIVASTHADKDCRLPALAVMSVVVTVMPGALVHNSCQFGIATQMNQKPKDKGDVPAPIALAGPAFQKLGVPCLRNMIWLDSWEDIPGAGASDSFKLFADLGFEITATVTCAKPPKTTSQVSNVFDRLHDEYGRVVKCFQVGNEPNLKKYWEPADLRLFVEMILVPASKALRRRGATILGPAISEDITKFKSLVKLGMCNWIDEADIHPYQKTADAHNAILAMAKDAIGTMPLNATEWNIHSVAEKWPAEFPKLVVGANQYLKRAFYYRSTLRADRPAGKQALFKTDWTPNEPYYSAFASMMGAIA